MTGAAWGHRLDVVEAIRGRRAIRDFHDLPLQRSEIEAVLDDAVWAPSSMNRQPWRFVVLEGRESLAAAAVEARGVLLAETPDAGLRALLERPGFNMFYNAPTLVVVCATQPDDFARKDACLAAAMLMLAAHGRGLGTCWIGLAEAWLSRAETKVKLGIPDEHQAVAPILIGRPAVVPDAPPRRPVATVFVSMPG